MTNRRANYPPVPRNRHETRKTKPFALHRTPMSFAVEQAMREIRSRRKLERQPHPALLPVPWPWSWFEAMKRRWLRWKSR